MAEAKVDEVAVTHRVVARQRLYVNTAGDKIVAQDSDDVGSLLAAEGDEIPRDRALELGLVKPTAEEKKAAADRGEAANE